MNETDIALLCKALGDLNRLKIVKILINGERCACKLLEDLEITQSTLSHHMKILCECGLVSPRYDGKWSYFSLNCETLTAFREYIGTLVCARNHGCNEDGGCDCS